MARLFRYLMMAAQGGFRYLRAILRAVVGLNAKATTAPSSDMDTELKAENPKLKAEGVSRPVAEGRFQGNAHSAKVLAQMIAKLVSDAIFPGKAGEVSLETDIDAPPTADGLGDFRAVTSMTVQAEAPPTADGKGDFQVITTLTAQAGAPPGNPTGFKAKAQIDLTAKPGTAPPVPTKVELTAKQLNLEATAIGGIPKPFTAEIGAVPTKLYAATASGVPAETEAIPTAEAASIFAKMHTWREPIQDGTNLYIPQVYGFVPDGTNLKIL